MKAAKKKTISYKFLGVPGAAFYKVLFTIAVVAGVGGLSALHMEHSGHWVTGMDNQIVWGMPHVFAVFLIVAASGALNVASIGTVFGRTAYKPLGRFSGLLALALLAGGLAVLVLDLGRPDRLIVAATTYNFKSIFAWNIFLYTGFMAVVGVYLWVMMDRPMTPWSKVAGTVAFVWRLGLTTGTGLIFGFLIAREAYDAAVMAPLFIAMSFSFGLAIFLLAVIAVYEWSDNPIGDFLVRKMGRLLGVFVAAVLYFVIVQHLTNLYAAEHAGFERFILVDGGIFTGLFWGVQIFVGSIVPLVLLFGDAANLTKGRVSLAAGLVIVGGIAQVYVIIIGGQAYPLNLFPGMEVTSNFFDGAVSSYVPSLPEIGLGVGGVALAAIITLVAARVLRFLPDSLTDEMVDPHHTSG